MIANQEKGSVLSEGAERIRKETREGGRKGASNLIPGGLVCGHVALELRAVGEGVAAEGAGEVLLVLLMAVLDVLLQRSQALVAPVAVGAGQQLGEGIWRSRWQVCNGEEEDGGGRGGCGGGAEEGEGKAGQKVSESMAANGPAAQK